MKGEKWKDIREESFNIRKFPQPLRHYFNIPLLLMINLRSSFTALLKFYYFAMHTFDYHNYNYIRFFFLLYPIHFHSLTRFLIQTSSEFNYTDVRSSHCVIPELDTHSAQNMLCTENRSGYFSPLSMLLEQELDYATTDRFQIKQLICKLLLPRCHDRGS
jgi:hypothetical protein